MSKYSIMFYHWAMGVCPGKRSDSETRQLVLRIIKELDTPPIKTIWVRNTLETFNPKISYVATVQDALSIIRNINETMVLVIDEDCIEEQYVEEIRFLTRAKMLMTIIVIGSDVQHSFENVKDKHFGVEDHHLDEFFLDSDCMNDCHCVEFCTLANRVRVLQLDSPGFTMKVFSGGL